MFSRIGRTLAVVCGGLWLATGLAQAQGAVAPIPVEAFFSPAKLQQATLSPSGRWLAALTAIPGRRIGFQMIDLDGKEPARFIEASPKDDVTWFRWVGDEWLVFQLKSPSNRSGQWLGRGLVAVKRDGTNSHLLIAREFEKEDPFTKRRYLEPDHTFLASGAPGTTEVIVGQWQWRNDEFSHITPKVLDIVTGGVRSMPDGAPRADSWTFDARGRARVASFTEAGQTAVWWADKAGTWRQIVKAPSYEMPFRPVAADGDDGLLVTTRAGSDGSFELRRFDFATGKPSTEKLLATPGFDTFDATVSDARDARLLGVRLTTDASLSIWFDPSMKAVQAKVDAKLPGTVNILQCRPCDGKSRVVVFAYSDQDPGNYLVYRPETDKWQLLGEVRPDIDPRRMLPREFHRTQARDGGDLPIWVTRPAASQAPGAKPAPTVVLVHGGPWVRGADWRWNDEVQFLASRGYVVVEPEFRGSQGYGARHYRAGFKQWGLTMQDDVSDALGFAVAQGWADAKRACIMGASYGGYATLMGLVKDPDQYRCGVAFAAVSDPRFMYDFHWSDLSRDGREFDLPVLLGDRVKDVARFIATSPLEQVARIKSPVLLAHGGMDRRVPIDNAQRMLAALRNAGKSVEWVEYKEEEHGFFFPENEFDYYRRVEAFLARHLK
jgi:dipeptidyl aminopeptidase/acylaminoacyl peptidase